MEVSQPLDHITHAVIGGGKTIDFGISDSPEFFDILSRTLYTDQILAVVREVLCNAWDAHIAAGCTNVPIQITLDSSEFVVRDFGLGIPHANIGPIYGMYGASTKRDDGSQTGGFGLGCKAPFAYTDHFEVVSCHGGTRTIYNMSKSSAEAKGKPGITTITQLPTSESGLQVRMPVQFKDFPRFKELIQRIVSNGEMLATLNGQTLSMMEFSKAVNGYMLTQMPVMGDQSRHRILLRYGNVIYPVDICKEIHNEYGKTLGFLNELNYRCVYPYVLVLQAPPDTISVTPSREALSMQEHTIETINRLLRAFRAQVKGLEMHTFSLAKEKNEEAILNKDYPMIFSNGWGFRQKAESPVNIVDMEGLSTHRLTLRYPHHDRFMAEDVKHRVTKATELKLLDPHLASTFLKDYSKISFTKYDGAKNNTDWLHRHVLGKVMAKLRNNGLDEDGLYIIDEQDPRSRITNNPVVHARQSFNRKHRANLPFLRKLVVITTSLGKVTNRLGKMSLHVPNTQITGMLCYHPRSRKADDIKASIEFFKKLNYEVIDFTKRQPWEAPAPVQQRKKAEPYAGLPSIASAVDVHGNLDINIFHIVDDLPKLSAPELVMKIGGRNPTINGYPNGAIRSIIKLYDQRLGIAKNTSELNKAMKHGSVEFQPVLEQEMLTLLTNSPRIKEYFGYDFFRVRDIDHRAVNIQALNLVFNDADLRKEFGLLDNRTEEERHMLRIFRDSSAISKDTRQTINQYMSTVPLAQASKDVAKLVDNDNELLNIVSLYDVTAGLKGPKRQTYLDIFLKILKG